MKRILIALIAIFPLTSCQNDNGWFNDVNFINSLTTSNIGMEKEVMVNGIMHKVRLIGIDEDIDNQGNKIHTTWEFANVISDKNGFSLATVWNDVTKDNLDTATSNYLVSTIRKNLVGLVGDERQTSFDWYTINQNKKEEESSIYNCSIFDMLPSGLKRAIKPAKKVVNIFKVTEDGSEWEETDFCDSLFLLTPKEMGYSEMYMERSLHAYTYYKADPPYGNNEIRVKQQVVGYSARSIRQYTEIFDTKYYESTEHTGSPGISYAGYNKKSYDGGYYWLRSPMAAMPSAERTNDDAWMIGEYGFPSRFYVYNAALNVAPAFCI